jgi:hypothetical protein
MLLKNRVLDSRHQLRAASGFTSAPATFPIVGAAKRGTIESCYLLNRFTSWYLPFPEFSSSSSIPDNDLPASPHPIARSLAKGIVGNRMKSDREYLRLPAMACGAFLCVLLFLFSEIVWAQTQTESITLAGTQPTQGTSDPASSTVTNPQSIVEISKAAQKQ